MKILEVILQKYEKLEEEEERKARAQRRWDREKEERDKKKEEAEMERWKNFALKQKRSSSVEVGCISAKQDDFFLILVWGFIQSPPITTCILKTNKYIDYLIQNNFLPLLFVT